LIINFLFLSTSKENSYANYKYPVDFWGDTVYFSIKHPISVPQPFLFEDGSVAEIQQKLVDAGALEIVAQIKEIIVRKELCDWLVYQLIRKASNQLIAKNTDYLGYTVTKWFLLKNLDFDPALILTKDRVLLYIKSNDVVYNTPFRMINNDQFICLNYHDYGYESRLEPEETIIKGIKKNTQPFTFKITHLPKLNEQQYVDKDLTFEYGNQKEHINIKLNSSLKNYFTNYPVTDYFNQFNIPLSNETKHSLISAIKDRVKGMTTKQGVEYIMYFTRYAFLFEKDTDVFGREKRLSPEETLLYSKSDCEDRSALFYSLIKDIYNLPMIVLAYPDHVTVAVKLEKPIGRPIKYENELYTICEPTPQSVDLRLGEQLNVLQSKSFEIAFAYHPNK
jgi:hypothetical protein